MLCEEPRSAVYIVQQKRPNGPIIPTPIHCVVLFILLAISTLGVLCGCTLSLCSQANCSDIIHNRLDYCNSLLYELPWTTIAPLQRVQNAPARLVLGLSPRDHVSSALQTLHWLPIYYRIQFKIALLMYNALAGRCLEYIKDIVAPAASNPGRQ